MDNTKKVFIEKLAMDVLFKYSISEIPANSLEKIAIGENIDIIPVGTWDLKQCGRIMLVENTGTVIFYNSMHKDTVKNFTIAHELGHYFLQHLDNENSEIICLERDFQKIEHKKDEKEVEANYFAACLLMPLNLLLPVFEDFLSIVDRRGVLYVDNQRCNFLDYKKCVAHIQIKFYVTETAIRYRLINLGKIKFNMKFTNNLDYGINLEKYLTGYEKNDIKLY